MHRKSLMGAALAAIMVLSACAENGGTGPDDNENGQPFDPVGVWTAASLNGETFPVEVEPGVVVHSARLHVEEPYQGEGFFEVVELIAFDGGAPSETCCAPGGYWRMDGDEPAFFYWDGAAEHPHPNVTYVGPHVRATFIHEMQGGPERTYRFQPPD